MKSYIQLLNYNNNEPTFHANIHHYKLWRKKAKIHIQPRLLVAFHNIIISEFTVHMIKNLLFISIFLGIKIMW